MLCFSILGGGFGGASGGGGVVVVWWWWWNIGGGGGGDNRCKGGSCNSCRRAIVKCKMCGENGGGGDGVFCGGCDGGIGSGRGRGSGSGVDQEKKHNNHY